MKKKLFALLLALVMAAGAVPTGAFAANANIDNTMDQSDQRSARPSNVEDTLEYERQSLLEYLDGAIAESVKDQSYYCKEIWNEINNLYTTQRNRILKIKKSSQFQTEAQKTVRACAMINNLGEMTLQYVQGKGDLKRLQQELQEQFKIARKAYKQTDYNDYYWNLYQDKEAEVSSKIKKVVSKGTFAAYADARETLDEFTMLNQSEEDDDWLMLLEGDEDSDEEEEEPVLGFLGQWLYTKSELAKIRSDLVAAVNTYVKQDLPKKGYKGNAKQFKSVIKQFQTDLKKIPDAETMAAAYEKVLVSIDKKAKLIQKKQTPPTNADIIRMQDKMSDVYYTRYHQKDYTEIGWDKLESIYEQAKNEVEALTDANKLKSSLITKMKNKMDKVPTKKEELSKAKTKYIAKLKKLLKSKKYDQKKLKPIVKKGVTAMKQCKDPMKVAEVYWKYLDKTEKAILTYKITTKAKGKGTTTRGGKVSYGDSYTVKVSPKPGHRIKSVFVDGKRSKLLDRYTFDNVKANHTVVAVFV